MKLVGVHKAMLTASAEAARVAIFDGHAADSESGNRSSKEPCHGRSETSEQSTFSATHFLFHKIHAAGAAKATRE